MWPVFSRRCINSPSLILNYCLFKPNSNVALQDRNILRQQIINDNLILSNNENIDHNNHGQFLLEE